VKAYESTAQKGAAPISCPRGRQQPLRSRAAPRACRLHARAAAPSECSASPASSHRKHRNAHAPPPADVARAQHASRPRRDGQQRMPCSQQRRITAAPPPPRRAGGAPSQQDSRCRRSHALQPCLPCPPSPPLSAGRCSLRLFLMQRKPCQVSASVAATPPSSRLQASSEMPGNAR